MPYKPDKFDRNMMRVVGILLCIGFGGMFLAMTIARFADPGYELFSIPNIIRGLGAMIFLVALALLFFRGGKGK